MRHRLPLVALAACFLLLVAIARGAPAAPPPKSPAAAPAAAPKLAVEKFTLPNGLDVIFHVDHSLPVVHLNVWYHTGSKNEKPGRTGFAHLFEHMMFEGSKNLPKGVDKPLQDAGATGINGSTTNDRTNYFETLPSEALEFGIWLESDRMGYLLDAVTQERLDNQREVVKNEKRQGENQPYGRSFDILFETLFPRGHPYSWSVIGSMEDLSAASLEDIKEFFRKYYAPNNASLVIAGDFDPAAAKKLVEKYFGPIAPGPAIERPRHWIPTLDDEKRITVTDRVPLPKLYLAWPVPAYFDAAEAPLDLAAKVLGGGKNSRLYKRLVFDSKLATDVQAYNYALEMAGVFGIEATGRPDSPLAAIEKICDEEIARLAKEGPTADELERARADQEAGFVRGLERLSARADRLNQYNVFNGTPDVLAADMARYQKVTAAEVRDAVRRYLDTRNRVNLAYQPETARRPSAPDFERGRPPFGKPTSFTPTPPQSRTLDNGLTVLVAERHEIPTVAMNLVVKVGAAMDPADRSGDAWLTAAMLDEGTKSRTAIQIADELDRLGATLNTSAQAESSRIAMQALARNLKPSLALMAEVALQPSFPTADLERVRRQRLDDILEEREDPAQLAGILFPALLFGGEHPYSRPAGGTPQSVPAITRADLQAFYTAYYRPENSALIFSGDVTLDQASALARESFGAWKRGTAQSASLPAPAPATGTRVFLVDAREAIQSQIRVGGLGAPRTTADYYTLEVLNELLGGSFTSRLNTNIRQQKGYSYGVFSAFSYRTQPGLWFSAGGVRTNVTKESLVEFMGEIRGLYGERPPTGEEIAGARRTLVREYAQRFATNSGVAGRVEELFLYGLPLETLQRYDAGIQAVTPAQIEAAAKKYLDPARLTVLVIGDLAKVEAGVRSLNLGPVAVLNADGKPVRPGGS